MKLLTFLVLLVILLVYAIIGGFILRAIELDNEQHLKQQINSTVYGIIENNACLSPNDIVELENIMDDMDTSGVFLLRNGSVHFRSTFDIRTSILIASGIFAGFGIRNAVPVTLGGKVFTAIYGLFIGFYQFFVICVMGDLMDVVLKYLYNELMKRHKNRRVSWFYHFRQLFISVIGFIFFIVIPAGIVQSIEFWSYGESLFFCLVNVITIGFGDYSPGASEVRGQSEDFILWYRMCVGFWLLIAIMWFATVIYQFNSVLSGFVWRTTEEIIDEGMERIDQKLSKNQLRNSVRRISQLRPLPPLSPLTSLSSSSPPPPSSSSSSSISSSSTNTTNASKPNLIFAIEQESSGDVTVIKTFQ